MGNPDYALSNYEFDLLWGRVCASRLPYPLGVPRMGRVPEEHSVLAGEVCRELAVRGLVAADGQVDAGLTELLRLLDRHQVAVELVGDIGYPIRALAVSDGRSGVLAVRAGGELWLNRIQPAGLAAAIVGLLPWPAAISVACPGAGTGKVVGEMTAPHESALNCRMSGRFGICTGYGEPAPVLLAWFDTDSGRYLVVHNGSRLRVGPADHADIERQVATILSTVERQ